MPRNGAGTATPPAGNPVVAGTTINTTWGNNTVNDIYNEISNSIAKDGQTVITANLPMAGFRLTGVGDALAMTQNPSMKQLQNDAASYITTIGGTGNAITLTPTFATTAYTAGLRLTFVAAASNTGAATVNVNSLGAKSITNSDGTALAASQITSGDLVTIRYTGSAFILESSSRSVRNPISVATIAALKAQTAASSGQSAFVQGYYADGTAGANNAGDGGGGWFYWDSASVAADNGGTVIQATAIATGRWLRVYEGPISVKWFGTYADGTADDSAAVAAAIAALPTGGGQVVFPFERGEVYACNITILTNGVHLHGTSLTQETDGTLNRLKPYTAANPVITLGNDSTSVSGVVISDMTIDGGGTGQKGLLVTGAVQRCTFNNLLFKAFRSYCVSLTPAAAKGCSYHFFTNLHLSSITAGCKLFVIDASAAGSYATAIFVNGAYLYTPTTFASRGIYCDSGSAAFSNTYIQCNGTSDGANSAIGIETKATTGNPDLALNQVTIDSDDNTNILIYCNVAGFDTASLVLSAYIRGDYTCDGKVRDFSGNDHDMILGAYAQQNKPTQYNPVAIGNIYLCNVANPDLRNVYFVPGGGTSPRLRLYAPSDFEQTTGNFLLPGETSVSTRGAQHPLWGSTTNATPKQLTLDGAAAGTSNQYVIPVNHSLSFTGRVLAHQSEAEVTKVSSLWTFQGVIHRGASGNVALVAAVTPTMVCQTASASTWVVAVTADTNNQTLAVTVTGQAGKSIKWICSVDFEDILYA